MAWRNNHLTWGWVTVGIHWLTVLAVLGLLSLGLWMVDLGYYHLWYHKAPLIHKSIGILLFGMTLFRLIWRLTHASPLPLTSHSVLEQRAAAAVHRLIYLLLLGTMITGYLISTAAGKPVSVFGWFEIPAIMKGFKGQADIAGNIHRILALSLGGLALLHALAALKHHFIDRDKTLIRMLGRQ